ncbi:MAG: preprotein translocase subunit SecA, partial [Leptonema sp. (in: Bacteria)]|nr:preprotein translocase subunit SecA [Leptonema sp. (in: bacteria)]
MISNALKVVFGTKHERDIKRMLPIVSQIASFDQEWRELTNEQIAEKTKEFRERIKAGESLDDILPEAFALVREAAWRALGMRHFDVQMMGGMVLHQGKIAEMKTGEGKTLTSTLPIYLNALSEKGVHVVTVNDYLAKRDAMWMKPVYDLLGVSVGFIQNQMEFDARQKSYSCDITYGTNNEFGFDYLRDNMVQDLSFRVQRGHNYAIVDEVDSILIDEARTPLIISGPTEENTDNYRVVDKAVRRLIDAEKRLPPPPPREVEPGKEEPHVIIGNLYDIDEKAKNVLLTDDGVKQIEEFLNLKNLYAPEHVNLVAHTSQALRAHLIYKDEVDYVNRDGEIVIVDEHTGRLMEGRRYSDGLHQAIEAKENVEIKQETQTLATVTFQNFFRMYSKLAGMTGTADTEAEEFKKIYRLDVVVVPTNVPVQRRDFPDRVYKTEKEKFDAIVAEIQDCYERSQPVLVGTISIEKSEYLSQLLKRNHIPHSVLNAKHHEREAEIVENAGRPGAVTVATNMAGRGTDIVLGGAPTFLKELETMDESDAAVFEFKEALVRKQYEEARIAIARIDRSEPKKQAQDLYDRSQVWLKFHNQVKEAGGLHIIGSERHESRRIDNQLRGRSGRQGDPGSSRFYLCLEDTLMRLFGGDRWRGIMEKMWVEEGQELEAKLVDRAIARAQKRVENHNFDVRKHLLEYDDVMNRQREIIYAERDRVLKNES